MHARPRHDPSALHATVLALIVAGILVWAAALVGAPVVLGRPAPPAAARLAAAAVYQAAGLVCHQAPARSFRVRGWPMPVCARCAGLYAGAVGGALASAGAIVALARRRSRFRRPRLPLTAVRIGLIASAVPTGGLWLLEWAGGVPVGNAARGLAALPLGAAVAATVVWAASGWPIPDRSSPSGVH